MRARQPSFHLDQFSEGARRSPRVGRNLDDSSHEGRHAPSQGRTIFRTTNREHARLRGHEPDLHERRPQRRRLERVELGADQAAAVCDAETPPARRRSIRIAFARPGRREHRRQKCAASMGRYNRQAPRSIALRLVPPSARSIRPQANGSRQALRKNATLGVVIAGHPEHSLPPSPFRFARRSRREHARQFLDQRRLPVGFTGKSRSVVASSARRALGNQSPGQYTIRAERLRREEALRV